MDLVNVGRLRKPFGVKGLLKVDIKEQYADSLEKADVVFVTLADGHIPYFVERVDLDGVTTIKFEDVDSPESASKLSMSVISLKTTDIEVQDPITEELSLLMLAGFDMYDGPTLLGKVEEVMEYPQQIMARVVTEGHDVLVPLPEEFIDSIDVEARTIRCNLPKGLVSSQIS